jgi:bacterial/archaeal transporter family protein
MFTFPDWFLWASLSAVFAAATAILAKIGLSDVDPDYATFLRSVVIVVALTAFLAMTSKLRNPLALDARSATFIALSGLAAAASWLCYFRALKLGDVAKVAPIDKLSVVLVAIFAVTVLGERPSAREWFGIALIGVGAVVLALKKTGG